MNHKTRFLVATLAVTSFLGSAGCFSYKKEVTETPAPASTTVVETPTSPVSTTESHTSSTTDPYGNTVQQQRSTTTTTTPGY